MSFLDSFSLSDLTGGLGAIEAGAGAATAVQGALQSFGVIGGGPSGAPSGPPVQGPVAPMLVPGAPAVGSSFFPAIAPVVQTVASGVAGAGRAIVAGAGGGLVASLFGGDPATSGFEVVRGVGPHERSVFASRTGGPSITPLREIDAIHPVTGKVITYRNKGRCMLFADDLAAVKRVKRVQTQIGRALPKRARGR